MSPKSVPHAVFKSILQKKNNKHGNIIDNWLMLLNYNKILLWYTVNPLCETWHPTSDHQSKTLIFGSFLLLWKISLSLSPWLRCSRGFPVVPTVNLHAFPSFAVFFPALPSGRGEFSGLINFAAHSWNRILRPPGLGLQCVRWYRAYLEIRSPWGYHQALTDWERGTVPSLLP